MSALITIYNLKWSLVGEVLDFLTGIVCLVLAVVVPPSMTYFLFKYESTLGDKDVKAKIGAMYEEYRIDKSPGWQYVSLFFFMRRFMLALSVTYVDLPFFFQLAGLYT